MRRQSLNAAISRFLRVAVIGEPVVFDPANPQGSQT
jgi:hypothetical protein